MCPVGGVHYSSLVNAAKVLEMDEGTLQVILYDCSAAGLLFISNDKKKISVHPKILRYALVREEFFESISLSIGGCPIHS